MIAKGFTDNWTCSPVRLGSDNCRADGGCKALLTSQHWDDMLPNLVEALARGAEAMYSMRGIEADSVQPGCKPTQNVLTSRKVKIALIHR